MVISERKKAEAWHRVQKVFEPERIVHPVSIPREHEPQLHAVIRDLVEQGIIREDHYDKALGIVSEHLAPEGAGVKPLDLEFPDFSPHIESMKFTEEQIRKEAGAEVAETHSIGLMPLELTSNDRTMMFTKIASEIAKKRGIEYISPEVEQLVDEIAAAEQPVTHMMMGESDEASDDFFTMAEGLAEKAKADQRGPSKRIRQIKREWEIKKAREKVRERFREFVKSRSSE